MSTPAAPKNGVQPHVEKLQRLKRAIIALRNNAGLTKDHLRVGILDPANPEKTRLSIIDGPKLERRGVTLRDERDVHDWLRDDHPLWRGRDPEKLVKKFRAILRPESNDRDERMPEPQAQANHHPRVKAKTEGKFFQAANAVFDWELPLRSAEIAVYLCMVRHANGHQGRIEKVSGAQIGRECGGMTGQYARRLIGFLERATMIQTTFEGGAQGGKRATKRKTNEYFVSWLTERFTRGALITAIEKARAAWCYECSGRSKHPGEKHPRKPASEKGSKTTKTSKARAEKRDNDDDW
jgi:hypothetical protein